MENIHRIKMGGADRGTSFAISTNDDIKKAMIIQKFNQYNGVNMLYVFGNM